jgi:hypothetical protein
LRRSSCVPKKGHNHIRIVWKGGATTEREVLRGKGGWAQRTPERTVALVRKLARAFDDAQFVAYLVKTAKINAVQTTVGKRRC